MIIHVLADASFDEKKKKASFAFWIETPNTRRQEFGRLRGIIPDSTNAELAALGKAICMAVEVLDLGEGDTIVARTDCEHAVNILAGITPVRQDRPADAAVFAKVRPLLLQRRIGLVVQRTKGHAGMASLWAAMNTWCDHTAKAVMAAYQVDRLMKSAA